MTLVCDQFYTLLSGDGWGRTGTTFRPKKTQRSFHQPPQWDLDAPSEEESSITGIDENLCLECGRPCEQSALEESVVCACCGPRKNDQSLMQRAMGAIRSEISCVKKMVQQEQCEHDYIIHATQEEALCALKAMVAADAAAEARERVKNGGAGHSIWELRGVHFGRGVCVNKTMDDFFMAFVMWGREAGSGEAAVGRGAAGSDFFHRSACSLRSGSQCSARYNISKALRRLQNFAMFQEQCYERFLLEPVTIDEVDAYVYSQDQRTRCMLGLIGIPVARGPQGHRIMELSYAFVQPSAAASSRQSQEAAHSCFRNLFGQILLMSFDDVAVTDGLIWREHLENLSLMEILEMSTFGCGDEYKDCNYLLWCCSPIRIEHFDIKMGPVAWYTEFILNIFRGFVHAVGTAGIGISSSVAGGNSLKIQMDGVCAGEATNEAAGSASKMLVVSGEGGVGVDSSQVGVFTGGGVADYARRVVEARGRCRWCV